MAVIVDLDSKPDAGASVMAWLATQPDLAGCFTVGGHKPFPGGMGPLRHHNHGAVIPRRIPPFYGAGHLVEIEWNLRQEDHGRAARDPAVKRNPARVPPHHLHDHDALVAARCRVQPVEAVCHRRDGGVESAGDQREGTAVDPQRQATVGGDHVVEQEDPIGVHLDAGDVLRRRQVDSGRELEQGAAEVGPIVRALDEAGLAVKSLELVQPTLDDVFVAKTGRHLEGDDADEDAPEAAEE